MEEKLLYHYCSNETMFSIVRGKQLWMADISRSNDYSEMRIFRPGIFFAIEEEYEQDPFEFKFRGLMNLDAIRHLLMEVEKYLDNTQARGFLTSFVICFSEYGDTLSQWRGYANDGKGCSIGFSLQELQQYCKNHGNQIEIQKVKYISKTSLTEFQKTEAINLLSGIQSLRSDATQLFSSSKLTDEQFEDGVYFLALRLFENFVFRSLQYKWDSFKEEQEWRLYFMGISKDDKTLYEDLEKLPKWKTSLDQGFSILHNRIDFYIKGDCLVPYFPIILSEVSDNAMKKVYLGPKNNSYLQDMRLLFAKERLGSPEIIYSSISYR